MRTVFTGRARLLSGAAIGAIMLSAIAGGAMAQTATTDDEAQVDDIIVTGIRAGIESAINEKKNNTSIVEVISAEDIGKLPDVSIAESLARLPGLASQRQDGRSQVISIRGLGPDFTTALLNGREQVTTGDNRGVEFDQYPSELLGSVLVYKTPNATLVGQGLAGTVDLRAVRPLEYGRQAIALNYRYEWNDIGALVGGSTDKGERYSVSYIDQFADDTIGVALGYAHMSSPYQSERYESWGYPTDSAGNFLIGGEKAFVMSSELERDGYFAVLEYRPNDRFHASLDAFYSEFDNTQMVSGIEFPLAWGGGAGDCGSVGNVATPDVCRPGPVLSNATTSDGFVQSGTFSNVKAVVRNDVQQRDSTLTSLGFNAEYNLTDDWSVEADLSYSKVERNDIILETYGGTGRNINGPLDTVSFAYDDNHVSVLSTALDYADPNLILLTSAQGWGGDVIANGQDGYLNMPSIDDELQAIRLTSHHVLHNNVFGGLHIGVSASTREKSLTANEFYLGNPGGASLRVPDEYYMGTTDLSYVGIPGVVAWDALGMVNDGFYNLVRNPNGDVRAKDWVVNEDLLISYVMLDIDAMAGSIPVTGNLGMQAQYVDQSSSGYQTSSNGAAYQSTYITRGEKYLEILPSLNLIFEVQDDLFVRTAVSRTLSRPRMDQMRASRTYSFNVANNVPGRDPFTGQGPWSATGGNPELRPWIADVLDLSLEKYFAGNRGYVSLAAFYRNLESFIYDANIPFDFSGYPTGGVDPVTNVGLSYSPQNGSGGAMYGLEFALSVPFDMFSEALDGFGAYFSASQNDSEIKQCDTCAATAIPGLSETVANLTVYYEKNGFQSRISTRYRSEFLGELSGFANGRTLRQVGAETIVDAQVGYEFQDGPAEGLSILAQVNNLTDEPFYTFQNGDERQTINFQQYGRTFLVGVNYRF